MSITIHPADEYWLTPADIRVNTVNCVGVMGKGIAAEFKARYPEMFRAYAGICKGGKLEPGNLHEYQSVSLRGCSRIWNIATKDHWRDPSQYAWIEAGIARIQANLVGLKSQRITIPALGCGNGGLDWKWVELMLVNNLTELPHEIHLFAPK